MNRTPEIVPVGERIAMAASFDSMLNDGFDAMRPVFSRLEDLYQALTDIRIKQTKAITMCDYLEAGRGCERLVLEREAWRRRIILEQNALRRIAGKGKRQAMISQEIAFYRWADERFGNPGVLTLMHYKFIRGFVHG